jgi:hypothetical protein
MNRPGNLGFVTDSPLFDEPEYGSHAYDLQQRGMAQRAMEAGRPLTVAEMHGGRNQQLFRTLGDVVVKSKSGLATLIAMIFSPPAFLFLALWLISRRKKK